ncbi:MAG TPA: hypothetical protein VFC63_22940, partial [Blastocatellia bacterium]|nr:hypothetical protein [Blastocatellia bacterium]
MKISVKNRAAIGQRSVRLVALTLCLITALPFTPFARQKSGQAYAIKGAQIVTVSGQVISSGNIIFRNGLITAVGANANIPADARVIDGSGLTVYPGLIDAFTNLGLPEPQNQQQAGGGRGANQQAQIVAALTGQQQGDPLQGKRPELMVTDELKPGGTAIENERNIGVTTALAVPRDGIFSGQSAVIDLNGDSVQQMVVKSPVGMHLTFNTVRGFGGGYPGSLMGVIAYMR